MERNQRPGVLGSLDNGLIAIVAAGFCALLYFAHVWPVVPVVCPALFAIAAFALYLKHKG